MDQQNNFSADVIKALKGQYTYINTIGQGSFGTVYSAIDNETQEKVAIKVLQSFLIFIQKEILRYFQQEAAIMKASKHQNIVKMLADIEDQQVIIIIMELCYCDLSTFLVRYYPNGIPESQALIFQKQILEAIDYLQRQNIIHRDLKLENIFVTFPEEYKIQLEAAQFNDISKLILKIADFGFAKQLKVNMKTQTYVGSPYTMAPEIYKEQPYQIQVDIYSAGVIFYQLLYNKYPFEQNFKKELLDVIIEQQIDFSHKNISEQIKNVISGMLKVDPNSRLTLSEIIQLPLFISRKKTIKIISDQESSNIQEIKEINQQNKSQIKLQEKKASLQNKNQSKLNDNQLEENNNQSCFKKVQNDSMKLKQTLIQYSYLIRCLDERGKEIQITNGIMLKFPTIEVSLVTGQRLLQKSEFTITISKPQVYKTAFNQNEIIASNCSSLDFWPQMYTFSDFKVNNYLQLPSKSLTIQPNDKLYIGGYTISEQYELEEIQAYSIKDLPEQRKMICYNNQDMNSKYYQGAGIYQLVGAELILIGLHYQDHHIGIYFGMSFPRNFRHCKLQKQKFDLIDEIFIFASRYTQIEKVMEMLCQLKRKNINEVDMEANQHFFEKAQQYFQTETKRCLKKIKKSDLSKQISFEDLKKQIEFELNQEKSCFFDFDLTITKQKSESILQIQTDFKMAFKSIYNYLNYLIALNTNQVDGPLKLQIKKIILHLIPLSKIFDLGFVIQDRDLNSLKEDEIDKEIEALKMDLIL